MRRWSLLLLICGVLSHTSRKWIQKICHPLRRWDHASGPFSLRLIAAEWLNGPQETEPSQRLLIPSKAIWIRASHRPGFACTKPALTCSIMQRCF
jgi:hypothetical protein